MAVSAERDRQGRASSPYQVNSLSDVVKFTALASVLAIFTDAAVAHAMFWGNDPYWTYWVTDTLLMATVFGLGTMLVGIGIGRGAIITAVHVLLLTTYYWSLSPIGLPQHPEWLDLERTWITGLPVHLAVYYTGYLGALWLWGRRRSRILNPGHTADRSLAQVGAAALATSVLIVVLAGTVQTLLLQEFPGITWFVMRIAVAVPFAVGWWTLAGTGRTSAIAGGVVLALLLFTYGHYLAPVGLPSDPARIFAPDSPPAEVHWLSFRFAAMVMLPLTALVAAAGYWLAGRWLGGEREQAPLRAAMLSGGAAAAALVILGALTAPHLDEDGNELTVASAGSATITNGTDRVTQRDDSANLRMTVVNRNTHRTPLPPHDRIDLEATISAGSGQAYEIRATQPMVSDPAGRFGTWYGVGFEKWHHGRSGIGLAQDDPTRSAAVAFALADIRSGGRLIATRVPLQVSVATGERKALNLYLASPTPAEASTPLHVAWSDFQATNSKDGKYARYLFGGGMLLVILGLVFAAAWGQRHSLREGVQGYTV